MNAQLQVVNPIVTEEVPAEIVAKLNEPLPPEAIKPHPTKAYLSTIKVPYVVERLNQVFGLGGWQDSYEVIEKQDGMVVVHGILYIPKYGITRNAFGGNDNSDLGDAYKGACTDSLSKMASFLGIGMDVYKGIRDGREAPKNQPKPPKSASMPEPKVEKYREEVKALGKWPTEVDYQAGTMRCFVLDVREGRKGKGNSLTLEVRHMNREGSNEVGTFTGFTNPGNEFHDMLIEAKGHNCEFKLSKTDKGGRTFINIVEVLQVEAPQAATPVEPPHVNDEDIPF